MERPFHMCESTLSGIPVLSLHGELDRSSVVELESAFVKSLAGSEGVVVLDCTHLTFIDCGFVEVLRRMLEKVPEGGWVGCLNMSRNPTRVLTLTGLTRHAHIKHFASVQQLQKALEQRSE